MPKSSYQKRRIIALQRLLLEQTDENHYLAMDDILRILEADGLKADKRTIQEDIYVLRDEIGMDIIELVRPRLSYAVVSRDFELQELRLLIDCVQASKFLTRKKADEMIAKISGLCSKDEARQLLGLVNKSQVKSANEAVFLNIDTIQRAINDKKAISFFYREYHPTKELKARPDDKMYHAYPYAIEYKEDRYYLIAHDIRAFPEISLEGGAADYSEIRKKYEQGGNIEYFRVDRMVKVIFSDVPKFSKAEHRDLQQIIRWTKHFDINVYIKHNFSVHGGQLEEVTIQFPNHMADIVLDRFGVDTHIIEVGNEHFQITEKVVINSQFYGWIFSLGKEVQIMNPTYVAQGMKVMLKDTYSAYTVPRKRKKSGNSS